MTGIIQADAEHIPLADQSVQCVVTSPPYCEARSYGINAQRDCLEWVDWMLRVVAECRRVSVGPVIIVAAGVTRKRNYWPACEGLMWEWWRRGGECQLYRPCIYHRVGIPGSGGKDWFRSDWEFCMCFKGPGKLPWSENTACGHPPKWAPGGEMSNRLSNGARVNQWGPIGGKRGMGARRASGGFKNHERPSHRLQRGNEKGTAMSQPTIANPGNVISTRLTEGEACDILYHYVNATKARPEEVLQAMRCAIKQGEIPRWFAGILYGFHAASLLRPFVYGGGGEDAWRQGLPAVRTEVSSKEQQDNLLLHEVQGGRERQESGERTRHMLQPSKGEPSSSPESMCDVHQDHRPCCASHRYEPTEQFTEQSYGAVQEVPQSCSHEVGGEVSYLWKAGEEIPGLRELVRQTLPSIQEAWGSADSLLLQAISDSSASSGIIHCKVGGGLMGHALAHENEAPFPLKLAEFFVRSLCPPGGIVLDPFGGSGTVAHAALLHGRESISMDLRANQCDLIRRRVADVREKAGLFGE